MRYVAPCLVALAVVSAMAFGKVPDHCESRNESRAWHNYGLELARNGRFAEAKPILEEARACGVVGSTIWMQSTIALAIVCEAMGSFDEADYYFAQDSIKWSATANDGRRQMSGAWRNLRKNAEVYRRSQCRG